ncbi:hypothetical protein HPN22_05935 [Klebsiella pneumoniae]|nr:hypothetical protein [Klebsiella pneumoniae]
MTTDITELAQREKFEAWVITQICISKITLEGLRTPDGYRNSALSGRDYNLMWNLWKAAGAELVEALEKAQQRISQLESRTVTVKLPEPPGPMSVGARTVYFGIVADVVSAFQYGLTAAGIKVEAD